MAGAKYREKNGEIYLRTSSIFWTMTSSYFDSYYNSSLEIHMSTDGSIYYSYVNNNRGLRAVINLRSDVLISSTSGDGSIEHPYIID